MQSAKCATSLPPVKVFQIGRLCFDSTEVGNLTPGVEQVLKFTYVQTILATFAKTLEVRVLRQLVGLNVHNWICRSNVPASKCRLINSGPLSQRIPSIACPNGGEIGEGRANSVKARARDSGDLRSA